MQSNRINLCVLLLGIVACDVDTEPLPEQTARGWSSTIFPGPCEDEPDECGTYHCGNRSDPTGAGSETLRYLFLADLGCALDEDFDGTGRCWCCADNAIRIGTISNGFCQACPPNMVGDNQSNDCVCPEAFAECGEDCVDTQSSDEHCGGCDQPCENGETCVNGSCTVEGGCPGGECTCPPGRTSCDGVCVDLITSDEHCGSCNHSCDFPAGFCNAGTCCSGADCL